MNIDQILDDIYPLPDTSKQVLRENIAEITHRKGYLLLRAGKIETDIYFIKRGMVRACTGTDGSKITFWFGKEGDIIVSMRSYVSGQKGYEDIELLEDCQLYRLNVKKLKKLFDEDIWIANWGRKLAERELVKTEERLISRQFRTATERYKELLNGHPELIQRAPLGHIASYLGITQVSLSRIRAGRK